MNNAINKNTPDTFVFTHRDFNFETGVLKLGYAYPGLCEFEETISFGPVKRKLSPDEITALNNAFRAIHLGAGVSYYKAYVPAKIETASDELDDETADFFENLYFEGLGEFAYRNEIKLKGKIKFPRGGMAPLKATLPGSGRTLVPVGGGKDSLVSVEILRRAGMDITLCSVNTPGPIMDCIDASGLGSIHVERKIDKRLLQLNEQGALNGHVPITAIVSFILLAAAIIHGFDAVAFSNERSASEGNTEWEGRTVNHQYSKSAGFEALLRRFINDRVAAGIELFSLLRPLSELHIASIFAGETRYDGVFSSCNRSYRIENPMRDHRWCCDCPKCRFVFLVLAPFMEKERLVGIFGRDMLDDASQLQGFRELVGLDGFKPWECVGETLESAAALHAIAGRDEWSATAVVSALLPELAAGGDKLENEYCRLLEPDPEKLAAIPPAFKKALDDATS